MIIIQQIEHGLKVETTKVDQQHGIRFFREVHPPHLNFARQNQVWMDVIKCCRINCWTYLGSSSFILFASNLEWLVTIIPEGIFSQLCFYAHFTRVSQQKVKTHIISQKCLFQDRSSSLGNLRIVFQIGEVVISRFMPTRFAIFMINICIYNHPFKIFVNRKHEGV